MLIAALVVLVIIPIFGYIALYNRLVAAANKVDAAWANIDAQLTRRSDLVPNLIETVKGYASHERETLDAVITARAAGLSASSPAAASAADGAMTGALRQLFALAEAYPQLRANENFLQLQQEVSRLETSIAEYHQAYNSSVQDLNTLRETFPSNLVAGSKPKFAAREYFEASEEAKQVPKISF
ncbi:MAG: LemA family protein [Verrucomicrobia bacterium]|nr:LemA family protein [Verrucomicrobiota bacterium]